MARAARAESPAVAVDPEGVASSLGVAGGAAGVSAPVAVDSATARAGLSDSRSGVVDPRVSEAGEPTRAGAVPVDWAP